MIAGDKRQHTTRIKMTWIWRCRKKSNAIQKEWVNNSSLSVRVDKLFGNISQPLANLDLLTRMNVELEITRRLKDEDNGASKAEPTHLLRRC